VILEDEKSVGRMKPRRQKENRSDTTVVAHRHTSLDK